MEYKEFQLPADSCWFTVLSDFSRAHCPQDATLVDQMRRRLGYGDSEAGHFVRDLEATGRRRALRAAEEAQSVDNPPTSYRELAAWTRFVSWLVEAGKAKDADALEDDQQIRRGSTRGRHVTVESALGPSFGVVRNSHCLDDTQRLWHQSFGRRQNHSGSMVPCSHEGGSCASTASAPPLRSASPFKPGRLSNGSAAGYSVQDDSALTFDGKASLDSIFTLGRKEPPSSSGDGQRSTACSAQSKSTGELTTSEGSCSLGTMGDAQSPTSAIDRWSLSCSSIASPMVATPPHDHAALCDGMPVVVYMPETLAAPPHTLTGAEHIRSTKDGGLTEQLFQASVEGLRLDTPSASSRSGMVLLDSSPVTARYRSVPGDECPVRVSTIEALMEDDLIRNRAFQRATPAMPPDARVMPQLPDQDQFAKMRGGGGEQDGGGPPKETAAPPSKTFLQRPPHSPPISPAMVYRQIGSTSPRAVSANTVPRAVPLGSAQWKAQHAPMPLGPPQRVMPPVSPQYSPKMSYRAMMPHGGAADVGATSPRQALPLFHAAPAPASPVSGYRVIRATLAPAASSCALTPVVAASSPFQAWRYFGR